MRNDDQARTTLRRSRRNAARQRVPLSEYISRVVVRDLGRDTLVSDPSVIFGLFNSGGTRIAHGEQAVISWTIHEQDEARGI